MSTNPGLIKIPPNANLGFNPDQGTNGYSTSPAFSTNMGLISLQPKTATSSSTQGTSQPASSPNLSSTPGALTPQQQTAITGVSNAFGGGQQTPTPQPAPELRREELTRPMIPQAM